MISHGWFLNALLLILAILMVFFVLLERLIG